MKILVVDDEPKIRRGLKALIERLETDSIVEIAVDGEEALNKVKEFHPDIVFTDIRIPKLCGLAFIKEVNKINNNICFIIVSGYADFGYVQEALKSGVVEYILKPVMPNKIVEALDKAKAYIKKKQDIIEIEKNLREEYLYSILFNKDKFIGEDINGIYRRLNIKGNFSMISLFINTNNKNYEEVRDRIKRTKNKFYEHLNKSNIDCIICDIKDGLTMLIDTDSKNSDIIQEILCSQKDIKISCSDVKEDIGSVSEAYKETLIGLENINIDQESIVYTEVSSTINKVINYIKKNYSKQITLADMAEFVYVHPTYLSKLFKKETGKNISDFIILYRIEKAKELLLESEDKIYMIAEKTGFKDSKYFNSVFKAKVGITPKRFRDGR